VPPVSLKQLQEELYPGLALALGGSARLQEPQPHQRQFLEMMNRLAGIEPKMTTFVYRGTEPAAVAREESRFQALKVDD